jgi:hypothetical protein
MSRRALLVLSLLLSACVPAARHRALEDRVGELEGVIARLRTVVVVPATPEDEAAARDLTDRVTEALQAHDQLGARALIEVLVRSYPDTRPARSIGQLRGRLSALGGEVGNAAVGGYATSVTLFDPSAPYFAVYLSASCQVCPQVAANAQQAQAELAGRVQVVGVVAAEETAYAEALAGQGVAADLPFLIDAGTLRRTLGAATTPHAALVIGGKVVWIGDHLVGHAEVVARHLPAE